jgi:sporulation protein YlmC with PRC-barrel domain
MLVLNSRLQNAAIMSLQSGTSLGSTTEPIIDPRKLQIIAFRAEGPRLQGPSILHVEDIREFGPMGIIVDNADSVMPLDDDLVRLQEVISLNFTLIGKQVIDENKTKLGKVAEYSVESKGFFIQKIHVGQSVLKNFSTSKLIIHRTQIVELTDRVIVVRSGATPQSLGLFQLMNPFRRSAAARPLSPEPSSRHHRSL